MHWFQFNLRDFAVGFLSILFEGVPFLFIGTFFSGLIEVFLPPESMRRWLPRRRFLAICVSALMGNVFPMCECGVVPVIRRMLGKGLPVSCGVTYLLAAPIVNPVVAFSTYAAFREQRPGLTTCWRLALGFLIAIAVGCVIERLPVGWVLNDASLAVLPNRRRVASFRVAETLVWPDQSRIAGNPSSEVGLAFFRPALSSFGRRLVAAVRCAAFDFLDVGFYFVIGALIASVFDTAFDKRVFLPLVANVGWATLALMGLALLLSLCSTSDAFIAATFVGLPFTAKLAFMVLGPMMDFKLLFMYGLVFRKRLTFVLALALVTVIGLVCVALHQLIP